MTETNNASKGTIFYVEDDKFLSDLLAAKLSSSGYAVEFHDDGQAAIDNLDDSQADLFIIDLLLPKVDGFEVISHIREHDKHKEKQVWVFSNYGDQDNIDKAFENGADKFLTKSSFVPDELISEIDTVLHGSNPEA